MNPYDWKRQRPIVEIRRPEIGPIVDGLRGGNSYVLLAARGMGKSVFLEQMQRELESFPDVRAVLISEPPGELMFGSCLEELGRQLGVSMTGVKNATDLVTAYFDQEVPANLVLLFDEFDGYARSSDDATGQAGRIFFNSLESMHRKRREVGILAAGSIGYFIFRDVLGSSFISRADKERIAPFSRAQIEELTRPFEERGEPLPAETVEALHLASGGNPALVTYGLQELWERTDRTERDVAAVFAAFRRKNSEFIREFQQSFSDPELSESPQRVLELVQHSDGEVSRKDLLAACDPSDRPLQLEFADVLDLLEASGLVKVTGSEWADPVAVVPITSIVSLPTVPSPSPDTRVRLCTDLESLLVRLHVSAADFFRPGTGGHGKRLVPESVFSAFLSLGFDLLGWNVDRESQRGAGRTDVLLRRSTSSEEAVVEVKIWTRYDETVQVQIESYWTAHTAAGAVVMLTDAEVEDWPEVYRSRCLAGKEVRAEETDPRTPIRARLRVSTQTADKMNIEVDHFLLRLPRGLERAAKP